MEKLSPSILETAEVAARLGLWSVEFYFQHFLLIAGLGVPAAVLGGVFEVRAWKMSVTARWSVRWSVVALRTVLLAGLLGAALVGQSEGGPSEVISLAFSWTEVVRLAAAYAKDTWPAPLGNWLWFVGFQTVVLLLRAGLTHVGVVSSALQLAGVREVSAEILGKVIRSATGSMVVFPMAVIQVLGMLLPVSG